MGNFYKKYIIVIFITLALSSSFFFLPAKRADAWWGVEDISFDPTNWVENVYNSYMQGDSWTKENILDPLAWYFAKAMIQSITDDLVNWINSGFNGNPAFVTNPKTYFEGLANQTSGLFMQQLGLEDICSPFKAQILFSLRYNFAAPALKKFSCTFKDAVANWDNFMGNFNNGGWNNWLSATLEPQNNPYGAYFMATDEMSARVSTKVSLGKQEILSGQGFLSMKKCYDSSADKNDFCQLQCSNASSADHDSCVSNCNATNIPAETICEGTGGQMQNTTPGKVIEGRLESVLGQDVKTLGVADELDEIIVALINHYMSNLRDGGSSYDSVASVPEVTSEMKQSAKNIIDRKLTPEINFRDAEQKSVDKYDWAIGKVNELKQCYEDQITILKSCTPADSLSCQNEALQADALRTKIDNETQPLIDSLESEKAPFVAAVAISTLMINKGEEDKNIISSAVTLVDLQKAMTDFTNGSGSSLHSPQDANNALDEYFVVKQNLEDKINGTGGIEEQIGQCNTDLSNLQNSD